MWFTVLKESLLGSWNQSLNLISEILKKNAFIADMAYHQMQWTPWLEHLEPPLNSIRNICSSKTGRLQTLESRKGTYYLFSNIKYGKNP